MAMEKMIPRLNEDEYLSLLWSHQETLNKE